MAEARNLGWSVARKERFPASERYVALNGGDEGILDLERAQPLTAIIAILSAKFGIYIDKFLSKCQIWPMLKTPAELQHDLAVAIRTRRVLQGWSQVQASARAGIPLRTWKRLEAQGTGHIENLINAAIALRCEDGIAKLFPAPAASSIDELLARQVAKATPRRVRRRAPPR